MPSHPFHIYTDSGLDKHAVWTEARASQVRADADGIPTPAPELPVYSQGSRGKSNDFTRADYWRLRGKLDVPTERFIAFTEVPGRNGAETLYAWTGWSPPQQLRAILAIDEELEDAGVLFADRIGLLDSAWRLLPVVAREDAAAATRLKAEVRALVGPEGPSRELIEDWKKRFPPPTAKGSRIKKTAAAPDDDESETEESAES